MITLVIIGVVAAITMPMIVADWQKKATTTKLKKVYSTFSNAVRRSVADNGEWYNWDFGGKETHTYQVNKDFAETYLIPYLNVGQVCEYGKDDACNYKCTQKGIWTVVYSSFYHTATQYTFALTDGTIVAMSAYGDGDKDSSITLRIDINGAKKPNMYGRDIFSFQILPTSRGTLEFLVPNYNIYSKFSRDQLKTQCKKYRAETCSVLLMNDGWEIKEDYPW